MNLFQQGLFQLHSGTYSAFKIDCDALSDEDVDTIAALISERLPPFGAVEGVPQGGLRLAAAMAYYAVYSSHSLLIVDDVFTSGASMEAHRKGRDALGAVIFARGETPHWILPLFTMSSSCLGHAGSGTT